MRHLPDHGFKWILHLVDHWSKFHFAFRLVRKTATEVADAPEKWVFPVMGLPSILHSDNGREFVNKLIEEVLASWPGQVQLVSRRPRHPQSQGLIEQAHYTLERMISAKCAEIGVSLLLGLPGFLILSVSGIVLYQEQNQTTLTRLVQ